MSLEHRRSHKQHGYICRNSQQYIVWVKIIIYFMPKIIRILRSCSMKIFCRFPTINISKHNFWLVICIAKNFIWTTLKMIFSIFRFLCILRFQILKVVSQCFRWCINIKYNFAKLTLLTGFVVQGHICTFLNVVINIQYLSNIHVKNQLVIIGH